MKTRALLLLGCIALAASASHAQTTTTKRELWVWKDASGVTHYSDVPAPGAKRLEVIGSTPVAPPPPSPAASPSASPSKPAADVQYSTLEIWQPKDGQNYFGADASVDVRIRSEPDLSGTDRLLTFLDGRLIEGAPNATEHVLTGLERGVHSLTATIVDAKGNEKIRSAPVVFNIRINAVNNPQNVGPLLKPHPQPAPAPSPTPRPTTPK